jgi:hypothetical protein
MTNATAARKPAAKAARPIDDSLAAAAAAVRGEPGEAELSRALALMFVPASHDLNIPEGYVLRSGRKSAKNGAPEAFASERYLACKSLHAGFELALAIVRRDAHLPTERILANLAKMADPIADAMVDAACGAQVVLASQSEAA